MALRLEFLSGYRVECSGQYVCLELALELVGRLRLTWPLGHGVSIATQIGFVALAGVAVEFGMIVLLYLRHASGRRRAPSEPANLATLDAAIREGAVLRVRPKAMIVAVILAALIPLFIGSGAGSEVMQGIAAPMIGGMVTAPLLSMLVVPAAYRLLRGRGLATSGNGIGRTSGQ